MKTYIIIILETVKSRTTKYLWKELISSVTLKCDTSKITFLDLCFFNLGESWRGIGWTRIYQDISNAEKKYKRKLSKFILTDFSWLICLESSMKNYKRMKITKSALFLNNTRSFACFCNHWQNIVICKNGKGNFQRRMYLYFT